jgi:hypothetical protein
MRSGKEGLFQPKLCKEKLHMREREKQNCNEQGSTGQQRKKLDPIGFGHIKIVHPRHESERLSSTFCTKGILLSTKP